jgi:hypothetical protein
MRHFAFSLAIAITTLLVAGSSAAQNDRKPPTIAVQQPTAGIDAITAYAGTWKVAGERFATAHSDAGKEESTLRNDCWKSGGYVACNQYVNGESKVLLVFTYSTLTKMYTSYPIPSDGEAATSGRLQIVGNVWTFPWEVTQSGVTTYFHVVNVFKDSDHIEYAQEFSPDNVHWTKMAQGTEMKVGN